MFIPGEASVSTECSPYDRKYLPIFDEEFVDPEIQLRVMTRYGPRFEYFLIDTGADVTLLPAASVDYFEVEMLEGEDRIFGVEGEGITVKPAAIQVEILNRFFRVRCAISDRDDIPFLLGRLDILDSFDLLFLKD